MNISLFLKSLSKDELNEFENYFIMQLQEIEEKNRKRTPIDVLLKLTHNNNYSIFRVLKENYQFVDELNEFDFTRHRGVGKGSWIKLKSIMDSNCL